MTNAVLSTTQLILASGSPRRYELMTALNTPFTVVVSDAEEHDTLPASDVLVTMPPVSVPLHDHPTIRAWRKGYHVASQFPDAAVIAADTIVVIDGQVLNKPVDGADAHRMLRMLSGRTHQVYTGLALFGASQSPILRVCVSHVSMQELSDAQIDAYVATGESLDKAGAYGIQGMAGTLVTAVEGSFTNVVGLPLNDTVALLAHVAIVPSRTAEAAYAYWRSHMPFSQIPHGSYL